MSLFLRTARIFSVKLFTLLFPVLVPPIVCGFFVLLGILETRLFSRILNLPGLRGTFTAFVTAFVLGGGTCIVAGIIGGAVWGFVALWNSAKSEAAQITD